MYALASQVVKLTYDAPSGWRAFAALGEAPMAQTSGLAPLSLLAAPVPARPSYDLLTQRINQLVPERAWKRAMNKKS
jgi:hypothetical protein